jgi:ClpA/ClpB-like protein
MGHNHVGAEHLFLAIIRNKNAIPTQILSNALSISDIEERLLAVIASEGYATPSRRIIP